MWTLATDIRLHCDNNNDDDGNDDNDEESISLLKIT